MEVDSGVTMAKEMIDPKVAKAIAKDVAELDGRKPSSGKTGLQVSAKQDTGTEEGETCNCTGLSPDGTPGTGLLDAHTICPRCNGTGKVVKLG
jgi:DnaJ-class molecular chaperone